VSSREPHYITSITWTWNKNKKLTNLGQNIRTIKGQQKYTPNNVYVMA